MLLLATAPSLSAQLSVSGIEAEASTESLTPEEWGGELNRLRLSAGAVLGGFHVFGMLGATGVAHARGVSASDRYFVSGIDTVINVPLDSDIVTDSLAVLFPAYTPWGQADQPFDRRGRGIGLLRVDYESRRGWDAVVSYEVDHVRRLSRSLENQFNPQGWTAERTGTELIRGRVRIQPERLTRYGISLHADARLHRSTWETGLPDPNWLMGEIGSGEGFGSGAVDFLAPEIGLDYEERLALGIRSGAVPDRSLTILAGRTDLGAIQGVPGVPVALRLNPYGVVRGLPVTGLGIRGVEAYAAQRTHETRLALGGDWRAGSHMLNVGADWTRFTVDDMRFELIDNSEALMRRVEPSRLGFHASGRIDIGAVGVIAGLRFDRIDPGGAHSRVPGMVVTIPDSLRGDAWELDPLMGPDDERTIEERLRPVAGCNGADVCRENFIATDVQTGWSPHISVGVGGPQTGRLRVGFRTQMHGPGEAAGSPFRAPVGRWTDVVFLNSLADVSLGVADRYGRDVRMPRTHQIEASYALELGERNAMELSIFRRTVRDALVFRLEPFDAGNGPFMRLALTNRDLRPRDGADARVHVGFGQGSELSLGYSYREVEEPAADSLLQSGLPTILQRGPAIDFDEPWSVGFGASSNAMLDQHRRHTLGVELSLRSAVPGPFDDAGIRAALRLASGLSYRRVLFDDSAIGPPLPPYTEADVTTSESTPWLSWLELRVHKGLALAGGRLRAFVHFAGPLRAVNHLVFLRTGTAYNGRHREDVVGSLLDDPSLDGDVAVDGFFVGDCLAERALCEVPPGQTAVNAYSLRTAEERFGDADGFFTVDEQRAAFGAYYDMLYGEQHFTRSDRSLRIGLEFIH